MNFGVKIELIKDFAIVRETLIRMGIVNKKELRITPTCYIYCEYDKYYICHFKELLSMFDDVPDELREKDRDRRDSICTLLQNWGMIEIMEPNVYQEALKEKIFVLTHKEKRNYTINHKFNSFKKLSEIREGI